MGLALVAGVIRGYCGFGFAMLLALGLMLFLPPVEAVPLALLLDLVTSVGLWRRALRLADWTRLRGLLIGMLLSTLIGIWLLASIPASPMRIVVALLALAGALSLLQQPAGGESRAPLPTRPVTNVAAGSVSGLCMTLASSGGPPLMLYLLQQRLAPLTLRATAIVFFAASSATSLSGLALADALGSETLVRGLWLLAPALLGNALGQWAFERSKPRSLKSTVAPLLIVLSLWVLAREVQVVAS
nr:sulfite exporter TauE/SafE family protein [Halomonas socia]